MSSQMSSAGLQSGDLGCNRVAHEGETGQLDAADLMVAAPPANCRRSVAGDDVRRRPGRWFMAAVLGSERGRTEGTRSFPISPGARGARHRRRRWPESVWTAVTSELGLRPNRPIPGASGCGAWLRRTGATRRSWWCRRLGAGRRRTAARRSSAAG
jgi:hypothetical protein